MRKWVVYGSVWLSLGLSAMSCQSTTSESKSSLAIAQQLPLATLSKSACAVGDSVTIHLAKPLSRLTVMWDGTSIPVRRLVGDSVRMTTAGKKVGVHELIVLGRGMLTPARVVADALTLELRSDIIPAERPFTVLATYPHDTANFTQGLEFYRGRHYESKGLIGKSRLMRINTATGQPLRPVPLPSPHFGEGITVANGHVYQLTWTSGLCFCYNLNLRVEKTLAYHTQGWGLTIGTAP